MRLSVLGIRHTIVQLVARVKVELEVWRHRCLYLRVKSLLHLLPDIFIVVPRAELLVKFLVLLGGVHAFNGVVSCRTHASLTSFTPILKEIRLFFRNLDQWYNPDEWPIGYVRCLHVLVAATFLASLVVELNDQLVLLSNRKFRHLDFLCVRVNH